MRNKAGTVLASAGLLIAALTGIAQAGPIHDTLDVEIVLYNRAPGDTGGTYGHVGLAGHEPVYFDVHRGPNDDGLQAVYKIEDLVVAAVCPEIPPVCNRLAGFSL